MQPAVQAVKLVFFVFQLFVRRIGEENDALMAASGDAHQTDILDIAVHGHFAKDLEDDRAFEHIESHTRLNGVQTL